MAPRSAATASPCPRRPPAAPARTRLAALLLLAAAAVVLAACAGQGGEDSVAGAADDDTEPITVYSGRSEELVGPILERFAADTGSAVEVRYGDTAEMAATILEEGPNSPADVFFGQDAGALGALRAEGRLVALPDDVLDRVDPRFRAADGTWVGTSGRARVLAYNIDALDEDDLPDSVLDLTDERWRGRVSWAPTNGSFQAFVTAMRLELGDDATRAWLEAMVDNDVAVFENNTTQVEAVGRGEVDIGLVNHYYLYRFLAEDPDFPVANAFLGDGDVGALVNIAGLGVLDTADDPEAAFELVGYLLSEDAQEYFATEVFEHPLVPGVDGDPRVPDIADLDTPAIDLSDLEDLEGTLEVLRDAGVL